MAGVSRSRGTKRKAPSSAPDPPCTPSKVTLLSPSLLLLEIPADTNTSLPVWEAIRSQQVDVTWTVSPYDVSVHVTPVPSKHGKAAASGKSKSTGTVAQTSALPSGTLQPQSVALSITQQHIAFQNTSCVLLTFSQSSAQAQPQAVAPRSLASVIISLPVDVTPRQPALQPSARANRKALPTVQALVMCPSEIPGPFHTRNSNVRICDDFLLNMCFSGQMCNKHHTLYPFHWQLWCLSTEQWVSISPRSQVLLERIYCGVSHDVVHIKDGNARYSLNLDTMELDSVSKYGSVRRLQNSDCERDNCYFPCKWKIYLWNNITWEEYNKNLSTLLLKKISDQEYDCSFHIGTQEYKFDFTRMIQTNVTTGFERRVRCRPVYRSPDSMQPYLKTVINVDSTEATVDPCGANFSVDPLEEFSSWYPPVWCLQAEEDYSLVDVPARTQAYRSVQNIFYETMPETSVDIISIKQIQNLLHWDKYQRHKAYMQKQMTKSKEPLERHLFHGTSKEASENICYNNFDPRLAGVNGVSNGFGSYFATTASYSNTYALQVAADDVRYMFLAKVLVGKVCMGKHSYRRPPPISSRKKHYKHYDSCVDNVGNPTMFVVFDSCQCYPYYLIKYKDLPKEIDI